MSTFPSGFDPFPKHGLPRISNEHDVEWDESRSPSAKFHLYEREMSFSMRHDTDGDEHERPPFEVALVRVPAGAANWPRHVHLTQWEYYIILAGEGTVVRNEEESPIRAGDHIMQPPGVAHHIVNTGDEELVYYIIADNPPTDVYYYPDSDKWGIRGAKGNIRFRETTHYWDGEDPTDRDADTRGAVTPDGG